MSIGDMLPIDNLDGALGSSAVHVDGPITGGAGLDLTHGTAAGGLEAGNVAGGGTLSLANHSAQLGVDPGTGSPLMVDTNSLGVGSTPELGGLGLGNLGLGGGSASASGSAAGADGSASVGL